MASTLATIEIPANADKVWQLIGGFNGLPDWLPYIPTSELREGGRVRRLETPNGEVIVERLEAFDDKERSYSYSIIEAPFPATSYRSTLRVLAVDKQNALVEWSGSFIPTGVTDEEVTQLFHGIYVDGLNALKQQFQRC